MADGGDKKAASVHGAGKSLVFVLTAMPAGGTWSHPVVLRCISLTIGDISLVTLSTLCTCRPLGCLLGYNVCSGLLPIF